jgi:hypothetical protein
VISVRLIEMRLMEGLKGKHFLDAFPSEICLKGGGALPPFLFNFAQEYVLRGSKRSGGTAFCRCKTAGGERTRKCQNENRRISK